MARIAGIDLPREKRIEVALTYIFGIGAPTARKLVAFAGINPDLRVKAMSEEDEKKLRDAIDSLQFGSRAICAARCRATSSASWISAVIAACAIGADCRFAVSERRRTPVRARVRSAQSPARKKS